MNLIGSIPKPVEQQKLSINTSLSAFEAETSKNKHFYIEQITEVEVLQKQNEFEDLNKTLDIVSW